MPLDKVRASVVATRVQATAARATGNRSTLALELVGYEPDVERAMAFAFGQTFICEDEHAARKVMESGDIRCRGVSLAGDDYNPNGVMTGGSRGAHTPVLTRLLEVSEIEEQLAQHQARCCVLSCICGFKVGKRFWSHLPLVRRVEMVGSMCRRRWQVLSGSSLQWRARVQPRPQRMSGCNLPRMRFASWKAAWRAAQRTRRQSMQRGCGSSWMRQRSRTRTR